MNRREKQKFSKGVVFTACCNGKTGENSIVFFYHNKKSQYTNISLNLPTALGAEKDELSFLKKRPCVLCKAQLGNDSIPETDIEAAQSRLKKVFLGRGETAHFW